MNITPRRLMPYVIVLCASLIVYGFNSPSQVSAYSASVAPTFLSQIFASPSGGTLFFGSNASVKEVRIDSSNNIYIGSTNGIYKYNSSGTLLFTAGSGGTGTGQVGNIIDFSIDASGNIYELESARIQKFNASGTYVTSWGSSGSGNGQLGTPVGIVADSSGNTFVLEQGNNRVQKFDSSGTYITQFANSAFTFASAIGIDSSSNVYVQDFSGIKKYTSSGTASTTWSVSGFATPTHLAVSTSTLFVTSSSGSQVFGFFGAAVKTVSSSIGSIYAVDGSGNLYTNNSAHAVTAYDQTATTVVNFWDSKGTGNYQFNSPSGVAVDPSGNILVSDSNNNRIQKYDSSATFASSIGTSTGRMAIDPSGNIYTIINTIYVRKLNSSGTLVTQWGGSGTGNGQFGYASAIALDSSGNVYVGDNNNHNVQKFTSTGSFMTKWGTAGSGNGQFSGIAGIAVDASDNVYVLDSGNSRVEKFDATGTYLAQWGSVGTGNGQFSNNASELAVDSLGYVYVGDNTNLNIQKFNSSGTYLTQWGSAGTGNGQFGSISAIAFAGSGKIYIVDNSYNRVSIFQNDITAPTVSITSPSGGANVFSTISVTASSSDNIAVSGVQFYIDSVAFGSEIASSPYTTSWNTASTTQGNHSIIAVARDAFANYATSTTVTVTVGPAPVAPSLDTLSATSIGTSTVTLNASITNAGNATSTEVGFNFGTTISYGSIASTSGSFTLNTSFQQVLTGLTCDTTYHYQAFATNSGGTGTSSDGTFTTSACPSQPSAPTVSFISSANLSSTTALFIGKVNWNNGATSTSWGFQYGPTSSYGTTVSSSGTLVVGGFAKTATGLGCDTSYHLRAFATNSAGTGYSPDTTFTSGACTSYRGTGRLDYFGYSDTLLVVNDSSATSTTIGNYFATARGIDPNYIVHITNSSDLKTAIESFITAHGLNGIINYIILTKDVPLKYNNRSATSYLAACLFRTATDCTNFYPSTIYGSLIQATLNPYFGSTLQFTSSLFGTYAVTRLDGYNISDIEALIDRGDNSTTTDQGQFVLDPTGTSGMENQSMLMAVPTLLARGYSVLSGENLPFIQNQSNVLGYYSWGSNDGTAPFMAKPHNTWVNGSISDTFVSTSARSFDYPPSYGQSLVADLVAEGVTGTRGYVAEPYSVSMSKAYVTLDRYTSGFNLADSYNAGSQLIQWMDTVVGDPKTDIKGYFFPQAPLAPINGLSATSTAPLVFLWQAASVYDTSKSIAYHLYLNGSAYGATTTDPLVSIGDLSAGTYTWSVRAFVNGSLIGSTSPRTLSVLGYPSSFDLSSPADATSTQSTTPTFSWSDATVGAQGKYQLFIDGQLAEDNITGTSKTVSTPLALGSHLWYVRAVNSSGVTTRSASSFSVNVVEANSTALQILSLVPTVTGSTSATISWTTNSSANTQVYFGASDTLASSSPLADASVLVTSHSVTLSNLVPCTVYRFEAHSTDVSSTNAVSPVQTFTTPGCTGGADILASSYALIPKTAGGSLTLTDTNGNTVSVSIPPAFASTSPSQTVFQAKQISPITFLASAGLPVGKEKATNTVYEMQALADASSSLISTFDNSITITLSYDRSSLGDAVESTLKIYRYDSGSGWTPLSNCSVNTTAQTVTCDTSGFSEFTIVGDSLAQDSSASTLTDTTTTTVSSSSTSAPGNFPSFSGWFSSIFLPNGIIATKVGSAAPVRKVSPKPTSTEPAPTPACTVSSFTRDLSAGQTSSDVRNLQKYLNAHGYPVAKSGVGSPGRETSFFGPATRSALMKFQRAQKLPSTGFFGPMSRTVIRVNWTLSCGSR